MIVIAAMILRYGSVPILKTVEVPVTDEDVACTLVRGFLMCALSDHDLGDTIAFTKVDLDFQPDYKIINGELVAVEHG